jgi:S1-C subfamily serine protease
MSLPSWLSRARNACALVLSLATFAPALASDIEAQSRALQRAREAVVGVKVQIVEGARTAQTLGTERQGSGVLISDDGLVLTIGYLVLEAESVQLVTDDGRRLPARVVAHDLATGFGLVQALAPVGYAPAPLATQAGAPGPGALTVVSGGDEGAVDAVQLVARRAFSGSWEYHVEGALFTAPPVPQHSGAALFNPRGELLGVGSLVLPDARGPGQPRTPGNLFVPVELLQSVLAEMRAQGRSSASARPWLGLNCAELDGEVRVLRVTTDSPADVAGLQAGDRITRVDGQRVAALSQLWLGLWADRTPERAVELEIERRGRPMTITVHAVDRAKTLMRAQGI